MLIWMAYLLVNFGGPRHLDEIEEFLITLLNDQEVIRTPFPPWIHRMLFTRIAKKRSKRIAHDYASIGGKSPIFEDTEAIAKQVSEHLQAEVLTFHRYLPKTHPDFINKLQSVKDEIRVFPLFPQFSYATTGSIALWFHTHFPREIVNKMWWVKSYAAHPSYISAFENCLRAFLIEQGLKEEECLFLFSAHGLPQSFIDTGDVYQKECFHSFQQLSKLFPHAVSHLSYQSQFGKEEWIRPYTSEFCSQISDTGRKVVVVPLSFTSDHIETLFEIEQLYLPSIREKGIVALRCPALNRRKDWIEAIAKIIKEKEGVSTQMLLRKI